MLAQSELESFLAICIVLVCLGAAIDIYWMLITRQIEAIRRAFARWVWRWEKDHRVEAYIEGLRGLVEDE